MPTWQCFISQIAPRTSSRTTDPALNDIFHRRKRSKKRNVRKGKGGSKFEFELQMEYLEKTHLSTPKFWATHRALEVELYVVGLLRVHFLEVLSEHRI